MKLVFTAFTLLFISYGNAQYATIFECGLNTQSSFTFSCAGHGYSAVGTFNTHISQLNPDNTNTVTMTTDDGTDPSYVWYVFQIPEIGIYPYLKFRFDADQNSPLDESFIYLGQQSDPIFPSDFTQWDQVESNQLGETVDFINISGYSTVVLGFYYIPEDTNIFNFNYFSVSADTTQFIGLEERSQNKLDFHVSGKLLQLENSNESQYQVNIYNLMGQDVFSQNFKGTSNTYLNLNEGLYIVKIDDGKSVVEKKVWFMD